MSLLLDASVRELLADPTTVKILATVDEQGVPHVVAKGSLNLDEDGNLFHLELIERSRTNRNLVHSLWHDRPVSVLLIGSDGRSVQIQGVPLRVHVSGPVFQTHYQTLRARLGDLELAGVWVIQPQRASNQAWRTRLAEEPPDALLHLDRIAAAN
jgi:hypothetical protein